MAKRSKRKRSSSRGNRPNIRNFSHQLQPNRQFLPKRLREDKNRRRGLTRDTFAIANRDIRLSLAEDLRTKHPFEIDSQGRKFRNVDGSLAMTEYKQEPIKKKTILLLGAMFTLLLILVRFLFADVDINVSKCFSLIKFW